MANKKIKANIALALFIAMLAFGALVFAWGASTALSNTRNRDLRKLAGMSMFASFAPMLLGASSIAETIQEKNQQA